MKGPAVQTLVRFRPPSPARRALPRSARAAEVRGWSSAPKTVESHRENLKQKRDLDSAAALTQTAAKGVER